jgi:hypothetical protein
MMWRKSVIDRVGKVEVLLIHLKVFLGEAPLEAEVVSQRDFLVGKVSLLAVWVERDAVVSCLSEIYQAKMN